ncbi:hypothetical protein BD779DRAFT_1676328 [Infundibulicybe gibba]|nr:hypothetical protein BD779DRAFT_1676328 [Infundibulicybe gibba]
MANLPVEIIQVIFIKLCSPRTTFPLRRGEPRLVVTRICSQWRAVALSTPTLWADFLIQIWGSPPYRLDAIHAWVSRSAQSTLSIEFRNPAENFISEIVADFVFPVIHRCSFLSLQLNTATLSQLLTLPPNSLCVLRSITFFFEENARVADPAPFATAFQSCRELHTFRLVAFAIEHSQRHPDNINIADFNVPWHQLTTLQLESPSIFADECLDIIRRCTSLQECRIFISAMDNLALQRIIKSSRHPVVLPFLHTLCIRFGGGDFMFLHALRLPGLRNFRPRFFDLQEWTMRHESWSRSVLQSVSCDALQELNLSDFPVYDSHSETLARMYNLTTLWLNGRSHQYPGIMRALGEGTIAPHLTTLHLGYVQSSDFLLDTLEARVAAARATVASLLSLMSQSKK